MHKYIIKFTKDGYIKYISHLDMLRIFKRALKKTGIKLGYSEGFNPHPKISFAQPLTLGFSSDCELLEMETISELTPKEISNKLNLVLPEGIEIISCMEADLKTCPIASTVDAAEYEVIFNLKEPSENPGKMLCEYMIQDEIFGMKRQKKTKKYIPINIKTKIRKIEIINKVTNSDFDSDDLILKMLLDCGNISNLNPELVIATFLQFSGLKCEKYNVDVKRKNIIFTNNLQF